MSEGRLQKKARAADNWIKSKVSWWPSYEQTAKKVKKHTKPGFSASSTIGASVKRILEGPKNIIK
jgi:hypothetical protein